MLQLICPAGAGLQAKEQRSAIAPLTVAIEFQHRQQLDGVDAEATNWSTKVIASANVPAGSKEIPRDPTGVRR